MPQLDRNDASLYFEVKGHGQPVLFIQGCGVTGSGWQPQVNELCAEFQCLSFDNRGIGRSQTTSSTLTVQQMAEDALALLDAMGWPAAHVVGHSLGGIVAQQLALDAPKRVKSLSLLCTFSKGSEGGRITPFTVWMGIRTNIGSRAMRRRAFLQMLFPDDCLRSRNSEELASELAPILGRDLADQPPILMKQVKALAKHDCSARLHELSQVPTLVVAAEKDPIALPRFGRLLAQIISGASYIEIEDASHGVCLQDPVRINALLRSHFRSASHEFSSQPVPLNCKTEIEFRGTYA
jgi:pimeloyl-ACP methyl ester carboxylesterase